MPVNPCPHCGARIRYPDGLSGSRPRCPKCAKAFDPAGAPAERDWASAPPAVRRSEAGGTLTADHTSTATDGIGGDGTVAGDARSGWPFVGEDQTADSGRGRALLIALLAAGLVASVVGIAVYASRGMAQRDGAIIFYALLFIVLWLAYLVGLFLVGVWLVRDAYNRSHEGALWAMLYAVPHLAFLAFAPVPFFLLPRSWGELVGGFFVWAIALAFWLVLSWLGFLLYWLARRPGGLTACDHCSNRRLVYRRTCPHCGRE